MENDFRSPILVENKTSLLTRVSTLLLLLVIAVELIVGFKVFTQQAIVSGKKLQGLSQGQIALLSDKSSYNVGDSVRVIVRVSTGGHSIVGSDIDLKYDPNVLEATSSADFYKGRVFDQYPIINFDPKGEIKVSGIVSPSKKSYSGIGVFGGIIFKAKVAGKTSVTLNFKPGVTTQSTITEAVTAQNILGKVTNLTVNIGQGGQSSMSNTCSPRVYQTCRDNFGRVGTQWCSSILDNPNTCSSGCYQSETGFVPGCKVTTDNTKK